MTFSYRHSVLLAALLSAACAPLRELLPSRATPAERLAASVTIVRDEWGVPHVLAATDAAAAFGVAYAQAEDDYWQIEEDYLRALGRASHWYGERYLASDLVMAAFEIARLAREEYEREPDERRAIWDAFAAGLNHYVRTSGVRPRLITTFEPWMPFALVRAHGIVTTVDGVRLGAVTPDMAAASDPAQLIGTWDEGAAASSPDRAAANAWALAPSRAEGGSGLLLQSLHGSFFGHGRPYEVMILSDEGWHVRGATILGTPVPRTGHNAHLAWALTGTTADAADVYEIAFDRPGEPLMYRFDDEWRMAGEWQNTLLVNSPGGVAERAFRFRRTHHGPIVAARGERSLALRVARMEEGGSLQQWYAMGRARNITEFRAALDNRALSSATIYADTAGNIMYVHASAVPERDTAYDWTRPVDGSTSATEWRGLHSIADVPQVLNPATGWLHGGSIAWRNAMDAGDMSVYPAYMVGNADDVRAHAAGRLLGSDSSWTVDEWSAAAFDTYLVAAEAAIPPLAAEWEQVGGLNPERARRLDAAIELLRSWDHVAAAESEAATLFVLWQNQLRAVQYAGEFPGFRAMENVVAGLERNHGSATVPWGEINRLQRANTAAGEIFADDRPSLPVPGAPAWAGGVFAFDARGEQVGQRQYGVEGHRWVGVVEVGPAVRARSIVAFGQSADPASPNYFDQAPLYARGELRPAWFRRDDVMSHGRRAYHPGGAVRELP